MSAGRVWGAWSSWRVVLVVVVAVGASALAPLPGRADSPSSVRGEGGAAPVPATRVLRTSPVDAAGVLRPGYRVVARARASCFPESHVHARAFRCFTRRSLILDPCWRQNSRRVACLIRPWSAKVTVLRLSRRLPRSQRDGAGIVWGLRVAGGVGRNCLFAQGATGVVRGRRLSYDCGGGWWLLGNPNRQGRVWTMATAKKIGPGFDFEVRGRKPLTTAWRPVVP